MSAGHKRDIKWYPVMSECSTVKTSYIPEKFVLIQTELSPKGEMHCPASQGCGCERVACQHLRAVTHTHTQTFFKYCLQKEIKCVQFCMSPKCWSMHFNRCWNANYAFSCTCRKLFSAEMSRVQRGCFPGADLHCHSGRKCMAIQEALIISARLDSNIDCFFDRWKVYEVVLTGMYENKADRVKKKASLAHVHALEHSRKVVKY